MPSHLFFWASEFCFSSSYWVFFFSLLLLSYLLIHPPPTDSHFSSLHSHLYFTLSLHILFHSLVCPIWTVTCLIFSRPSSPLCRALLQSPMPTVPGEVRFLLTPAFTRIWRQQQGTLMIFMCVTNQFMSKLNNSPSDQLSHLPSHPIILLCKPFIHPPLFPQLPTQLLSSVENNNE